MHADGEKFDAIVVGAGPAGTTAALTMAKEGMRVALLERGEYPGAKNVFGGVLYRWPLEEIVPKFWETAPLERQIVDQRFMVMSKDSGLLMSFKVDGKGKAPYNGYTAIRAKFDRWYASRAEEAGVMLATSIAVDDVIEENGKVVGIRAGQGAENELYADVVIGADGVNSSVAVKANLRSAPNPDEVAIGVKEVIELPAETIEARFNLRKGEGARMETIGCTHGKMGGGFVYTNSNSLSVGVVILLSHLMELQMKPYQLLDEFKSHSMIEPLIAGGKAKEYSAHLIPEAGYSRLPRMYGNGVMIAGDAAYLCSYPEGTNLAMASGMMVGKVALHAKKSNDFSAKSLSIYQKMLDESYVMKEMKRKSSSHKQLIQNQRLFGVYPDLVGELLADMLHIDSEPKSLKHKRAIKKFRQKVGVLRAIRDAYSVRGMAP
ncbi:MAG: FAD-dependent oxidoreductase [Thaumarchaeota archaeon]|nr:FAD-dependent oxidoreductase [Nitrososphaerota archaeon]